MTSRARLFADLINSSSSLTVPAGTDAQRPESPLTGTLRYSTTSSALEVYNGTAWVGVGGGGASVTSTSTAPVSPNTGDMWHNTTNHKLYVYYNAEWVAMKSGSIVSTNDVFTGNGSQVNFTLSSAPTNEDHTLVAVGGVVQEKSTYSISGSTLTLTEAPISGDSIEVMIFNAGVEESATATPKISNIQVTDSGGTVLDDTAVDIAGGYIKLTGTGFASGCQVIVNNVPATSTTFVSSTVVRAQLPATAAGTYIVYLINSDGGAGIRVNGVTFSATPSWVTGSALQGNLDSALSLQLSATGASTFALQSGSTLPAGLTLSSGGLISGTVTGLTQETVYSFTVIATDAENQDSPRTFSITITVGDQYFNRTVLAINGDVNTFVSDESTNNFPITVVGDTKPSAFSPYNTNWSNEFDGTGDSLQITGSAALSSTGDFTIEGWGYFRSISNYTGIFSMRNATNAAGASINILNNGNFDFSVSPGGEYTATAVPLNRWFHVALVRSGSSTNNVSCYLDGVRVAQFTSNSQANGGSNVAIIGRYYVDGTDQYHANGFISNVRYVNGTALYSGAAITVPTTPLTAVTNTVILTCQSNRIRDNSTNAFAIQKNGDTKVSAFGPFTETDTTTGSGYFDGTGDYLSVASGSTLAFGASADFTIEGWYYPTAYSANTNTILSTTTGDSASVTAVNINVSTSGEMLIGGSYGTGAGTVPLNTWTHFVVTRISGILKIFLNGVERVSSANTSNFTSTGCLIGGRYAGGTYYVTAAAYISNVRIVPGTGVTSVTVPSSPLTSIANTSLLTLQTRQPVNNHTFIDNSGNNFLLTKNGNVSQGSFSPFSPAGWSNYFDGSGDSLTAPAGSAFAYGTGDFTIEGWFYQLTALAYGATLYAQTVSGTNYILITAGANSATPANNLVFHFNTSGAATFLTSTNQFQLNQWNHFAVVRQSGVAYLYINGVANGSAACTQDFSNTTYNPTIGTYSHSGIQYFTGYISNFRIVKGTALYTSNFTPPTSALTAIANTSLLTCQSNRFRDNSTNNFTITKNGDTKVVNFSPFKPATVYSPATHGGSAYFDGTGDYLTFVNNALPDISGAFTYEFWIYPLDGAVGLVFGSWNNNTGGWGLFVSDNTGSFNGMSIVWYFGNYGTGEGYRGVNSVAMVTNAWNHIAVVRNTSNVWAFYVNGIERGTSTYSSGSAPWSESRNFVDNNTVGIGTSGYTPKQSYISDARLIVGSAIYNSNFTPPTAPLTRIGGTTFLINSNNAAIVDVTSRNVMETVGDAKIVTSTKKYGTGSMYFDGTGDYVSLPSNPLFAFGTGNFTVECWLNTNDISTSTQRGFLQISSTAGGLSTSYTSGIVFYIGYGSNGGLLTNVLGTNIGSPSAGIAIGTWYHVAAVRNSGVVNLYLNGTSIASGSVAGDFTGTNLVIGGYYNTSYLYNGYIDDLRITRFARYTTNFTPPISTFLVR